MKMVARATTNPPRPPIQMNCAKSAWLDEALQAQRAAIRTIARRIAVLLTVPKRVIASSATSKPSKVPIVKAGFHDFSVVNSPSLVIATVAATIAPTRIVYHIDLGSHQMRFRPKDHPIDHCEYFVPKPEDKCGWCNSNDREPLFTTRVSTLISPRKALAKSRNRAK